MIQDPQSKQLRQAINERDLFTAKMLLERGVDPNRANLRGNTALHRAVISGDMQMVELVLNYRPDREARNRDGRTAAGLADHLGLREIAARLGVAAHSPQRSLSL
jgi:ankyrin repeat protein